MNNEIKKLQKNLLDQIVVLSTIYLCIDFIVISLRYYSVELSSFFIIKGVLVFVLLCLAFFGKKLSFYPKLEILTIALLGATFLEIWYSSLTGFNIFHVAIISLLAILITRKQATAVAILICLIFSGLGICYAHGFLIPSIALEKLNKDPFLWLTKLISIVALCYVVINSFHKFYQKLNKHFEEEGLAQTKYKTLFKNADIAIFLYDKGVFFDVNNKACELLKLKRSELIGKSPYDVSPEFQANGVKSTKSVLDKIDLAYKGKPQNFEWRHLDSNGQIIDCIVHVHLIELDNQKYLQAFTTDISREKSKEQELNKYKNHLEDLVKTRTLELGDKSKLVEKQNNKLEKTLKSLQKMQSQLVQSEKMASLGVLTAGVSHEINNPLQYLFGIHKGFETYFEQYQSQEKETTDLLLSSTNTAINRISSIVRGLNQFSRDNNNLDEDCNIHTIIDNCLSMLRNQYKNHIHIDTIYCSKAIIIKGNVGKLHQVFTNILSNAIQSIEKEGKIIISTSFDKSNAKIKIIDNGYGIEEEHLLKITDPFYSTKNPGKGTGLGLSISYSIVKNHNGSLKFKSTPNTGTEVCIKFPLNKKRNEI